MVYAVPALRLLLMGVFLASVSTKLCTRQEKSSDFLAALAART